MSTTVLSYGFIAKVTTEQDKSKIEELNELFWDGEAPFQFTYDGSLIFADYNSLEDYGDRECYDLLSINGKIKDKKKHTKKEFIKEITGLGIDIDEKFVKPYHCVWYNGSDSPVSMLTVEEFEAY